MWGFSFKVIKNSGKSEPFDGHHYSLATKLKWLTPTCSLFSCNEQIPTDSRGTFIMETTGALVPPDEESKGSDLSKW